MLELITLLLMQIVTVHLLFLENSMGKVSISDQDWPSTDLQIVITI